MSDPGSIRYSVGGGVLTVSNDLMVFVAPGGAVADEWSELALAPATEAELAEAMEGELPADHYVAVVQLHDGGAVLLSEPDGQRFSGRVERSAEGRIRFGMAPSATSSLWVGSGMVGASGLEVVGFALAASNAEAPAAESPPEEGSSGSDPDAAATVPPIDRDEPAPSEAQPPQGQSADAEAPEGQSPDLAAMLDGDVTIVDLPVPTPPPLFDPSVEDVVSPPPPPPANGSAEPLDLPSPPTPPPPVLDPPVLSTSLFPDLPTEAPRENELGSNPVIERAPTPPPPGLPVVESPPAPSAGRPVSLIFDDGQNIPLTSTMAIGRAPEGSELAPPGCVVVVVAGDQVSRCHFVIRPTASGAEVIDTNSLNGCFVDYPERPGTGPQIPVGVPVPIEPGQQLRFGDRALTVVDQS